MKHGGETWSGALDGYLTTMRAAGKAAGTINLHRHYLGLLRERHRHPWSITTRQLLELVATAHWEPETRKSCRAVLRGFYRWGLEEGLIDHNPAAKLPPVRVQPGLPNPTPEPIVESVVHSGDPRLELMGMLAAYLGMRAGEIAQVHRRDVVPFHGALAALLVHGKGGKSRLIPITDEDLAERLEAIEGWAFPNRTGLHLSPGHVSRLMSRAQPANWTAHKMRHRAATVALWETGDIYAVQQMLGHARLETTTIYALLPGHALIAAVAAASKVGSDRAA